MGSLRDHTGIIKGSKCNHISITKRYHDSDTIIVLGIKSKS